MAQCVLWSLINCTLPSRMSVSCSTGGTCWLYDPCVFFAESEPMSSPAPGLAGSFCSSRAGWLAVALWLVGKASSNSPFPGGAKRGLLESCLSKQQPAPWPDGPIVSMELREPEALALCSACAALGSLTAGLSVSSVGSSLSSLLGLTLSSVSPSSELLYSRAYRGREEKKHLWLPW